MITKTLQQKTDFSFRPYQLDIIERGVRHLLDKGWCYLAMEVRTGKTLTALGIAEVLGGPKNVVFVTKKKAINSIQEDFNSLKSKSINLTITNYESLHKLDAENVDVWILDEAHTLGAFPKPSLRVKQLKQLINSKVIFLSGTPTPESNSQIYHQLYCVGYWQEANFYKWAANHVNIKERHFAHAKVNDYSDCHYNLSELDMITFSQKEAGFISKKQEHFITVKMSDLTKRMIDTIKKDKIFRGKNDVILADTSVKEMSKIHQLSSGTVILDESNEAVIIDDSKAIFIAEHFKGDKIAIFYKFKAELDLLKKHLNITDNIEEFNTTDKNIALQFVSGREGIKLDKADCIVALNIDFSATTYFQFRDRMTTKERLNSDIYYIISDCGIEMDVYKAVSDKKNYTKQYYERGRLSEKDNKEIGGAGLLRSETDKDKQKRHPRPDSNQGQQNLFY